MTNIVLLCLLALALPAQTIWEHYDDVALPQRGDQAPMFRGVDQSGRRIDLASITKQKQVLLFFYRGAWCPYCRKHLKEFQTQLHRIDTSRTQIVVVTPERPVSVSETVSQTGSTLSIISDTTYSIMKAYGVAFRLNRNTVPRAFDYVIRNTRKANGNSDDVLPIPATFIIDRNQRISYVHMNPDYRVRATVDELLPLLQPDASSY